MPAEILAKAIGLKFRHVPYTGGGPCINAVVGKHVDFASQFPSSSIPVAKGNKLRILAVQGNRRLKSIPDVPTVKELGIDAEWYQWVVFFSNSLAATYRFWFYPPDLGAQEHPPAIRAALQARIEGGWAQVDTHLQAHGPYMLGTQFSGVDLLATMLMRWSRNMPRPATEWSALRQLAALVRARPSWKKLYEVEGLTEW